MITTKKSGNGFEEPVKHEQDDFTPLGGVSFLPTDAIPGSEEKIEVLCRRFENGQPLWHDRDRVNYEGLSCFAEPKGDLSLWLKDDGDHEEM